MKYNTIFLSFVLAFFVIFDVIGDCGDRYQDSIFDFTVETLTYDSSKNLVLDIYQPIETSAEIPLRPLIIYAHGGGFVGGHKNVWAAENFCQAMASRGYVTASINYTLSDDILNLVDSIAAIKIVMEAVSDGKEAVRYFRADAANGNQYHIDSDLIFFAGSSAGGILASQLGMLTRKEELPEHMLLALEEFGGIEGITSEESYSSAVQGVINLAGGLNSLSFLDENDPPIFSCHGDLDTVVPYDCNDVYWGQPGLGNIDLVDICGSAAIHPIADELGIINELLVFEGADHTPWSNGEAAMEMAMDSVIEFVTPALYAILPCSFPTHLDTWNASNFINVYPNPTSDFLQIEMPEAKEYQVALFNSTGQVMAALNMDRHLNLSIDHLSSGIYFLQITNNQKEIFSQKIIID